MEDDEEEGVKHLGTHINETLAESWHDSKGDFHRLNGPAITFHDGDTRWYKHGFLHRLDGPARIWPEQGIEHWYKDGDLYEPTAHEIIAWKMKKKQKKEF